MTRNYLVILFSVFFLNCSKSNEKPTPLNYDTKKIAILDSRKLEDFKNRESAKLGNNDIAEIERLLKLSVSNYNSNQVKLIPYYQKKYPNIKVGSESVGVIILNNYKRQYVPYVNRKGEKVVWVYCTINKRVHKKWKTELQFAFGGGSDYFRVTINLSNKTYEKLFDNGSA
ncbi:MAG: hypothetical protein ACI9FW_000582 [Flavobacterium sp.]|jgi:hypothetical protein